MGHDKPRGQEGGPFPTVTPCPEQGRAQGAGAEGLRMEWGTQRGRGSGGHGPPGCAWAPPSPLSSAPVGWGLNSIGFPSSVTKKSNQALVPLSLYPLSCLPENQASRPENCFPLEKPQKEIPGQASMQPPPDRFPGIVSILLLGDARPLLQSDPHCLGLLGETRTRGLALLVFLRL